VQGLDFLNCTLQYDPAKRLNWEEVCKHKYFTTKKKDMIPLILKQNETTGKIE
jgi:hypothetical protein